MSYLIIPSKKFEKDFGKLSAENQLRILQVLEKMKIDPYKVSNFKKLTNEKYGIYRIRAGEYRLRFDIEKRKIYLHRLRHRKDIYK